MIPKPSNICEGCPAWAALEPQLEAIDTDFNRSMREQRQYDNMASTVTALDVAAGEIVCKNIVKSFLVMPAGSLAIGTSELIEYINSCPAFLKYMKIEQDD